MVTTATPTCSNPPAVTGGTVVTSGPYYNGSVAVYQCLTGYILSGDSYITCDGTSWSTNTVSCSLQDINQIDLDLSINNDNMPLWLAYLIAVLVGLVALLIISCIIGVCCYLLGGRGWCWGDQRTGGDGCCRRNRSDSYDTKRLCKTLPRRYEYDENGRRYHLDDLGRRCYYNHKNQLNHVKVVNYQDSEGTESVTPRTTFVTAFNELSSEKRSQPAKEVLDWKPHKNPVRNINTSTK